VVTSDTAGFLYLLAFTLPHEASEPGASGVGSCIFPSAGSTDNQIRPGTPKRFKVPAIGPPGRDWVVALVSTTRLKLGDRPQYTLDEVLEFAKQATGASARSWQSAILLLETIE